MEKIKFDDKIIEKKTMEICNLIEGLSVPEVMSVLGTSILCFVESINNQNSGFTPIASDWLLNLAKVMKDNDGSLQKGEVN